MSEPTPEIQRALVAGYDAAAETRDKQITTLTSQRDKLVKALEGVELFFPRPGESSSEAFERVSEVFRRETGYVRPGKDCIIHDSATRQFAWDAWVDGKLNAARQALQTKEGV